MKNLDRMLAILRSTAKRIRWTFPDPSVVFLPAGSSHDAFVEIRKIIEQVTIEVFIVDPYVDQTLWALLSNLPKLAKIRILTERPKADFAVESGNFGKQHGNTIEARTTSDFHDRFIIVDGTRCWHPGASIKDAGNKAFAFTEFVQPKIVASVKQEVESSWNAAAKLI
jgi:hypothetical protein